MGKLALTGGAKTVTLNYSEVALRPVLSEREIEAAVDLMRKGQISTSPVVFEFEEKFANYIGTKYALTSTNGTSSLHEALFAVGVGPGAEVIVPSYTFWASAAPIYAANGIPVFCDVDPDTFCLDPEDIKRKITPKTKAIMVVHVWGNPADMDAIMEIARDNNIAVIEDASHAHGAEWDGKKIGCVGDIGCFSLQGSKVMVAGEGGILTTNNREYYERAVALGHYERLSKLPEDSKYRKYSMTGMGYKNRSHPIGIAMANKQLDELDERNGIRDSNAKYLEDGLKDIGCIKLQKVLPKGKRIYSYHYAKYDKSQLGGVSLMTFLKAIRAEGVICGGCGYGRLHEAPLFVEGDPYGNDCPGRCPHSANPVTGKIPSLPVTEAIRGESFMLAPRFEKPCKELLDEYIKAYHKVVANVDELVAYEKEQGIGAFAPQSGRSVNLI